MDSERVGIIILAIGAIGFAMLLAQLKLFSIDKTLRELLDQLKKNGSQVFLLTSKDIKKENTQLSSSQEAEDNIDK